MNNMKKSMWIRILCLATVLLLLLASCGEADGGDGSGSGSGGDSGISDGGSNKNDGKAFSDSTTCDEILNAALSALSDAPNAQEYYSVGNDDADKLADEFDLSLIEFGTFEECPEFEDVKDYAMYICGGNVTFEIQVLKASNEDGAQRLKKMLNSRIETISGGDKAMYDPSFSTMIKNAETYTDGQFAILLITGDNTAAKEAIAALKK